MKDLLIKTLEPLGYPILQQGSMSEDDTYPNSFFTFWNNASDGEGYYNDEEHYYVWSFDLNFYSIDPSLINAKLLEAKSLLKAQGFITSGKGYDVLSDEISHTGRGINILKIEMKEA